MREILASDLFQGEHVKFFNKVLFLFAFMTPVMVQAQAITPTGTFGSQPTMTFGGSGIPNHSVMTNSNASQLGLTLGLSASQRCGSVDCGPLVTNNGNGVFYASPGVSNNAPSPGDPYASWNWNWYIGGSSKGSYTYAMYFDFNPAAGNSQATHQLITTPWLEFFGYQNSWNLGMNFLDINGVTPPNFDPNAVGEYTFALAAFNRQGVEVARSAIQVNVGTPVPEPSSFALLAVGTLGIAGYARRKKLS